MHSHQYHLRSTMTSKTQSNNNLISLSDNNSITTESSTDTSSSSQIPSTSYNTSTLIFHNLPPLKFDESNVEFFFQTFTAQFLDKHLTDEQMYFELIKCITSEHFRKASVYIADSSAHSFIQLKTALIKAFNVPLSQRLTQLRNAPALGDRTPNRLLLDLKHILGTVSPNDETLHWFLKSEFLNRLPSHLQFVVAAFPNKPLEEIAHIADSMIESERSNPSSSVSNDHLLSTIIGEISSIKADISSLHQKYSPSPHAPPGPNLTLPGRKENINNLCFYHHKYGFHARYCVQGCIHYNKHRQQNQLNQQGGAPR